MKTALNAIREGANNPAQVNLIPESDVYRLIMRSNTSKADNFQTWVCEEILPSIRKTGSYSVHQTPQTYIEALEALLAAEKEKQQHLELIDQQQRLLGCHKDWKSVVAIPWLKDYFKDTSPRACGRIGRMLTKMSQDAGVTVNKVEDARWGQVNAYHISVIEQLRQRLLAEVGLLGDIRHTPAALD